MCHTYVQIHQQMQDSQAQGKSWEEHESSRMRTSFPLAANTCLLHRQTRGKDCGPAGLSHATMEIQCILLQVLLG